MDKEIQRIAWSCLPKEFKEEVKKLARLYSGRTSALFGAERHLANKFLDEFIGLFGRHNLTSDAEEEEDEMLCVRRKEVQGLFSACNRYKHKCFIDGDSTDYLDGEINILTILFGSKCLPDEPTIANNATVEEPKPAGPRFRVGQKVRIHGVNNYILCGKAGVVRKLPDEIEPFNYKIDFEDDKYAYLSEEYLEPYTEPEESPRQFYRVMGTDEQGRQVVMPIPSQLAGPYDISKERTEPEASTCTETCTDDRPSQCKSQDFDNILKDSFSKERRLNIAAMMVPSVIATVPCSENEKGYAKMVATRARILADALISECEKGGDA